MVNGMTGNLSLVIMALTRLSMSVRNYAHLTLCASHISVQYHTLTKKDFIDIYFLLQHYSLADILGFYNKKYPEHSEFRALMSLTYFEDAEEQLMPKMFKHVSWENIKADILKAVDGYKGR